MAQKTTVKQLAANLLQTEGNVRKLYAELKKLSKGSEQYKFKLKQLNAEKQKGLKIDDQIRAKMRSLNAENSKHTSSITAAANAQSKFSKTLVATGKSAKSAGNGVRALATSLKVVLATLTKYFLAMQAIVIVLRVFNELTFASFKRAIKFEKALADLSAIAGLTKNETKKLGEEIFRVAGSTSFTAEEVAGLQKQLAKLGTSSDDIVKLTRPIALLAQALGESPDGAATAVKKFLNQFGQTTQEAGRFSNAIVGIVNESALSLQTLGTSMQYVGPLAYQAGLSFEETASYLGVLADNGLTASRAGTGLRAVLAEAAKSGKPFNEFIQEIADEGLSAAKALDIFGKRGAGAALILSRTTSEVKDLNTQLADSDRLFNANVKQMATTQGQIDILKSAYDKFSISLGEVITQSNFFLGLIQTFDVKSAALANVYRIINDASIETKESLDGLTDSLRVYTEDTDRAVSENQLLGESIAILKETGDFSDYAVKDIYRDLREGMRLGLDLNESLDRAIKLNIMESRRFAASVKELVGTLREQAEVQDLIYLKQQANTDEVIAYRQEYADLLSVFAAGYDDQSRKAGLLGKIQSDIAANLNEIVALRSSGAPTQQEMERIKILELENENLNEQYERVRSLQVAEDTLLERRRKREAARKKAFQRELAEIQKQRKDEVDAINEQAKVQTALALSAEERAEIELNRSAAVSAAYRYEESQLKSLGEKYKDFAYEISKAAEKAREGATIEQSEVIDKARDAFDDYTKGLEDLNKKLEDGEISQETYNNSRAAMTEGIQRTVQSLKDLVELTPELEVFFDELADKATDVKFQFNPLYPITQEDLDYAQQVRDEEKQKWVDLYNQINQAAGDVLGEASKTQLENTKNRLKSEIDAIKERYEIEEDLLKASLNNQLITESQYRAKAEELKKKEIQEENEINKQIFEAEKKRDLQLVGVETLQAIASNAINNFDKYDTINAGIQTALGYATILGAGAAKSAAIASRKFYPVKYEEGGLVEGPSHAQGGVPFTVQGQGGYEMEGGEFIVNKKASSLHRALLESINNSVKPNATVQPLKFAQGGIVTSSVTNVNASNEESVNYLKAIAEATSSTAIQTSKPMRAFVSDKDLRKSANERRLRERNDRI
jgi:hypothetical protein